MLIGILIICFLSTYAMKGGLRSNYNNNNNNNNNSTTRYLTDRYSDIHSNRAMVLCTGNHMVDDANDIIYQTRNIFNSSITIAIAHCTEISSDNEKKLLNNDNVVMVDLCDEKYKIDGKTLGLDNTKKIKGWFCKAAALIISPYKEVMVVDLDVVWFKKPDVLFNSLSYKKTGALFFRDRLIHLKKQSKSDRIIQDVIKDLFVVELGNVTKELALKKQNEDGYSFFWRNIADEDNNPPLQNFQDSSVILLDRSKHPKMLKTLTKLLPYFNIGWGDKEIYWIAATIAQEPFSFEPFLVGSYGDCGLLLHYDPNDMNNLNNAKPIYLNGEWLLEKIHVLGHDLEFFISKPQLVNKTTYLYNLGETKGCYSKISGLNPVPFDLNQLLLRAQWERLSRGKTRLGPEKDCMPIYKPTAPIISTMLNKFILKENLCTKFGCTYYPIFINHTFDLYQDFFCDPLTFSERPTLDMLIMEDRAQFAPPLFIPKEGAAIKASGAQCYIFLNGSLHAINNPDTYFSLGLEWSDLITIAAWTFEHIPIGDPIPNCVVC